MIQTSRLKHVKKKVVLYKRWEIYILHLHIYFHPDDYGELNRTSRTALGRITKKDPILRRVALCLI